MLSVQTPYEHITLDEKGIPVISGTTMKVSELVVEKLAHGWSAEELYFQHPYLAFYSSCSNSRTLIKEMV